MQSLLKVGYTSTSVAERMEALNTTGVPAKFVLEFCIEVHDGFRTEKHLHGVLENFRYGKEFFKIPISKLVELFKKELLEGRIEFITYYGKANNYFLTPQEIEIIKRNIEERKRQKAEKIRKDEEARKKIEEERLREQEILDVKIKEFLLLLEKFNPIIKARSELANLSRLGRIMHIFDSYFEDGRKIALTFDVEEKRNLGKFFELIEFFGKRNELQKLLEKDKSHLFDALFDFHHFSFTTKDGEKKQVRRFDGVSEHLIGALHQIGLEFKDRKGIRY